MRPAIGVSVGSLIFRVAVIGHEFRAKFISRGINFLVLVTFARVWILKSRQVQIRAFSQSFFKRIGQAIRFGVEGIHCAVQLREMIENNRVVLAGASLFRRFNEEKTENQGTDRNNQSPDKKGSDNNILVLDLIPSDIVKIIAEYDA